MGLFRGNMGAFCTSFADAKHVVPVFSARLTDLRRGEGGWGHQNSFCFFPFFASLPCCSVCVAVCVLQCVLQYVLQRGVINTDTPSSLLRISLTFFFCKLVCMLLHSYCVLFGNTPLGNTKQETSTRQRRFMLLHSYCAFLFALCFQEAT